MKHPGFRTLVRYVDQELESRARPRVAAHLLKCVRCHHAVEAISDVHEQLRQVALEVPVEVVERAITDRASGVRLVLPAAGRERPPLARRGFIAAAAVAFMVGLGALSLRLPESESLPDTRMGDCMPNEFRALASAAAILVAAACAQEPTGLSSVAAVPTSSVEMGRVREGTWSYRAVTWMADGVRRVDRTETYAVDRVRLDGRPLYRTVGTLRFERSRAAVAWVGDTAFFAVDDLTPVRQAAYLTRGQILELNYTHDSVTGFLGYPERRRAVQLAVPRDGTMLLGSAYHRPVAFLFLQAVPLDRAWAGSARTVTAGNEPFGRLAFSVVGEGRVQTPAGTFDCWRLRSPLPAYRRSDIWVSKQEQWIVKIETNPDPDIERKIELLLVSYSLHSAVR